MTDPAPPDADQPAASPPSADPTHPSYDVPAADRLKPGSRAVIARDYDGNVGDGRRGGEYVIGDYFAPEADSDADGGWHPAAYDVEDRSGRMFGGVIPHAALTLTMTAAEHAAADRPPTVDEIAEYLSGAIIGGFDDTIDVNETQPLTKAPNDDGFPERPHGYTHGVEFYGRLRDGATFGCIVRVTGLWRTDP